jgi:hypothetical protein
MFAEYNYEEFPYVKVKFSNTIENNEDFDSFLAGWIELYNQKKNFTFIFDTTNVGFVNPKYCVKMAMFIHSLKQREIQYLQQSFIIVSSKLVERLLELIFFLQKPVAPVHIIKNRNFY